uniref:Uncharacterized protein n=1 Tax=Trichobilharzia regenti TaxID=157069 RepID=A0AA85KH69_TRIRE
NQFSLQYWPAATRLPILSHLFLLLATQSPLCHPHTEDPLIASNLDSPASMAWSGMSFDDLLNISATSKKF